MVDRAFVEKIVFSFLRAFGASLIVTAIGVSQEPDLNIDRALVVSAVIGGITAGFRAVQVAVGTKPHA